MTQRSGGSATLPSSENELLTSGILFVTELKKDSEGSEAASSLRRDWEIVARWLGHTGGELSKTATEEIGRAWRGYLAIGLAPSHKLQPAFNELSERLSGHITEKPPTEIMDVFDRLMATDSEISAKRNDDLRREGAKFQPLFDQLRRSQERSWWRRQSPEFRTSLFACVSWMAVVLLYAMVFDPFDVGGWDNMDGDEMLRVVFVSLAPVGGGLLFYVYRNWVK